MFDSVRTRLTLWYTGVLALVLIIFCASVYYLLDSKLHKRLDAEVRTTLDGVARLLAYELAEGESETQAVHSALNEHYFPNQAAAIFNAQGHLLAEKILADNHRAELPTDASALPETIQFYTLSNKNKDQHDANRVATQRVKIAGSGKNYLIVVSQPMNLLSDELAILREILLAAVPLALAHDP